MSVKFTSYRQQVTEEFKNRRKRCLAIVGSMAEGHVKDKIEQNHSVQSGVMIGSIANEPRGENSVAIGTNTKYAIYVEMGHHQQPGRYVPAIKKRLVRSYVPAKPFLRPAIESHANLYGKVIEREMKL